MKPCHPSAECQRSDQLPISLNPSRPQDNLPQPQKLTVSPDAWASRGCCCLALLWMGCVPLPSANSPLRAGNTLWRTWETHLKGLGGWVSLWLRGLRYLLPRVVAGPSDKQDKRSRACFVAVPLMTANVRGQRCCTFSVRYCRRGVVFVFFFFFSPNAQAEFRLPDDFAPLTVSLSMTKLSRTIKCS